MCIRDRSYICNFCYEKGTEPSIVKTQKVGTQRSGTGDIFSAIISADAVNGVNFHDSVKRASLFIKKCILRSIELDIPVTDGVCFEEVLYTCLLYTSFQLNWRYSRFSLLTEAIDKIEKHINKQAHNQED